MAVTLVALDAVVHVRGPAGARVLPMPGFHRLPGDEPERDTELARDELIVSVELPALDVARRSTYRKVRERASFAFANVSLAAALQVRDGTVDDVRLALGAMAHAPWRAERAEAALRGGPATAGAFAAAAEVELAQARPLRNNGYKVAVARELIARTLADLAAAS
jgi:xanthine dehydrogenase YagS FAD-binding subunit